MPSTSSPKSRSSWPFRIAIAIVAGLAVLNFAGPAIAVTGWAASKKISGLASECGWDRIATIYSDNQRFIERYDDYRTRTDIIERDEEWGLVLVKFGANQFWIKEEGHDRSGPDLIAYLHAEHESIIEEMGGSNLKAGDIALDLGAHVGTFTRRALDEGAAKVIAVDPDPTQVECLNRNFAKEIEQGRVIVVPKAIWNDRGTLTLHTSHMNSAMSSIVRSQRGGDLEVPTLSIDQLVAELGLERVDYMKIDIEGAEREALEGARDTIARFQPRLLIDSYHMVDDAHVLPRMVANSSAAYTPNLGWCEMRPDEAMTLVPHFVYTL